MLYTKDQLMTEREKTHYSEHTDITGGKKEAINDTKNINECIFNFTR